MRPPPMSKNDYEGGEQCNPPRLPDANQNADRGEPNGMKENEYRQDGQYDGESISPPYDLRELRSAIGAPIVSKHAFMLSLERALMMRIFSLGAAAAFVAARSGSGLLLVHIRAGGVRPPTCVL
jgi:hypothetical protein